MHLETGIGTIGPHDQSQRCGLACRVVLGTGDDAAKEPSVTQDDKGTEQRSRTPTRATVLAEEGIATRSQALLSRPQNLLPWGYAQEAATLDLRASRLLPKDRVNAYMLANTMGVDAYATAVESAASAASNDASSQPEPSMRVPSPADPNIDNVSTDVKIGIEALHYMAAQSVSPDGGPGDQIPWAAIHAARDYFKSQEVREHAPWLGSAADKLSAKNAREYGAPYEATMSVLQAKRYTPEDGVFVVDRLYQLRQGELLQPAVVAEALKGVAPTRLAERGKGRAQSKKNGRDEPIR